MEAGALCQKLHWHEQTRCTAAEFGKQVSCDAGGSSSSSNEASPWRGPSNGGGAGRRGGGGCGVGDRRGGISGAARDQPAAAARAARTGDPRPWPSTLRTETRWEVAHTDVQSVQTVLRSFLNARINKHFRKYIDTYTRSHLYKCNYTWLYIKVHDYKMRHIVKKTTKHKITDFKNKQKYIHWLFCLTNLGLYKYISHEKFEKIVHFNVKLVVAMLQSTRPPSL